MTDPLQFASTTPRHSLPMLFTGQIQKELTVNEALSRLDGLIFPVVSGVLAQPPAAPVEGDCWRVGPGALDEWQGHEGALAHFAAGRWHMIAPVEGMRIVDASTNSLQIYRGGWQSGVAITTPAGGTTVDTQARSAISQIISALQDHGIATAE